MRWIIQNNLNYEEGIENLKNYLIQQKIPVTFVYLHKNSDCFYSLDGEVININNTLPVMPFGSYKLYRLAKEKNLLPKGFLNENFSFELLKENYLSHNLLNDDITIIKIKDVKFENKPLFIRPLEDNKLFTGRVFHNEDFEIVKHQISANLLEEYVILSTPKEIESEYRLFIVDGKIVTGSLYKMRNQVIWSDFIDAKVIRFAELMIEKWTPSIAYALDIALINGEPKIIEINNINSAGLYKSDITKIVNSIENLNYL